MPNKKAYYLGGGGVNEPTPGEKKYKSDKAIVNQPRFVEPLYRNYDLYDVKGVHGPGAGWHHMSNFKSIKEFIEFHRQHMRGKYVAEDDWIEDTSANHRERVEKMKIRSLLLAEIIKISKKDNGDYMLPPKEHGTKIYDWKNSPYQGVPKAHKCDDNDLDFPIDDQVSPILGDSDSVYLDSIPISYQENYTAEPDQDGKPESNLDFGYDLTNEDEPIGRENDHMLSDIDLDYLESKYLTPSETEIYGLPDGVDSEDKDPDQTIETENPYFGITDSGRQMYEDKWNI